MEEILLIGALDDNELNDDDIIDDALILHILHDNENLGNRAALYGHFNLNEMFETECKKLFRFERRDILRLIRGLGIPNRIVTNLRISVTGDMALCILLRRLAYPNRLYELESLFGLSSVAITSVINHMLNINMRRFVW